MSWLRTLKPFACKIYEQSTQNNQNEINILKAIHPIIGSAPRVTLLTYILGHQLSCIDFWHHLGENKIQIIEFG